MSEEHQDNENTTFIRFEDLYPTATLRMDESTDTPERRKQNTMFKQLKEDLKQFRPLMFAIILSGCLGVFAAWLLVSVFL